MMAPIEDMMPMAPQMMGCCYFNFFGAVSWMVSITTPRIAIGAIVYLLTKRPETGSSQDFSQP